VSPLFMAAIEAAEEAIVASLFAAVTTTGRDGRRVEALPLERVVPILKTYQRIKP
jgi:D-aminopeptidase